MTDGNEPDIKPGQKLVQNPTPTSAAASWFKAHNGVPEQAGLVDEHAVTRSMQGLPPLPK